jgi:hypothetical protein
VCGIQLQPHLEYIKIPILYFRKFQWGVLEVLQIENMMKLTGSFMQLWVVNTKKVSNEKMKMIKDVQCILLIMPSISTCIYEDNDFIYCFVFAFSEILFLEQQCEI